MVANGRGHPESGEGMGQKTRDRRGLPKPGAACAAADDRLTALVRLLARQAAKEIVAGTAESEEKADAEET